MSAARALAPQQRRTHHRHQVGAEQVLDAQLPCHFRQGLAAGYLAGVEIADGDVDIFGEQVESPVAGDQAQLDRVMQRGKPLQAGQQPLQREIRLYADHQLLDLCAAQRFLYAQR
jgi:hypothetical protein